ncbi:chromosome partitioning protein [Micromonospora sp. WMMD1102]|uniref:MinD/ParA family ATP-binding protein n=1 Tax=Micromonospora sp. WMMD1102 TaxID=3016105 RepID=UPI0024154DD3|nr:chromosome partitioning protein [Micromonospora sp. WMMD1102]MDG4790761.1 chromosome partitioning protein [Micromonospora sp. WMMD1102]
MTDGGPGGDAGPAAGASEPSTGVEQGRTATSRGDAGGTAEADRTAGAEAVQPEAGAVGQRETPRAAEPARGRATLPATSRSQPDGGPARPPAESPWAQPPQRPVAPQHGAPVPVSATPLPPPPTAPQPIQPPIPPHPVSGPGPATPGPGPGSTTPGADPASASAPPVGPYPPTISPGPYSATARPVSAYPPGAHQPGPPPAPTAGYPAYPPQPADQPGPPGYPSQPGYPSYPPPPPPASAPQSGWAPPPAPPVPPVSSHPPHRGVTEVPQQPYAESAGVQRVPAQPDAYPDPLWTPDSGTPTAEDFARRRAVRPADPVAQMGVRAAVNKTTLGLVKLAPGRHEQEIKQDIEMIRRNFGGLRQVTVVNPKGGAGKTVAILLLAMTFGQKRGGYVLAWDNNETQGTLGMRAQQDFHSRTVRDMLRDLYQFKGAHGRVGDLSQYVRSQSEGMFDVLASDESATGGEMLTAAAFAEIREVVSRFYKLIFVDTGNNVRAQNWQAAIDATDQLVVTMSARNDSAETAARMLDHLEQSGRQRLVRQAVTVVSMPPSRKEIDLPAIQRHFAARTRAVLLAPYERLIDTGEPIRYAQLSSATRDAWLKIAASVAEGL